MSGGMSTDDKFLLLRSGPGIHLDTYQTRRALAEDQIRMLFVDVLWHSGITPAEEEQILRQLAAQLVNYVNGLPAETLNDYESPCETEGPEDA